MKESKEETLREVEKIKVGKENIGNKEKEEEKIRKGGIT